MSESPMHDGARFIWRGRDITNYGALGATLCKLRTPEDAADFWNAYVEFLSRPTARLGDRSPHDIAGSNIGYLMGYYGESERERVYGLFAAFDVSHPIFGRETPTAEQALEAGKRMARGGEL